MHSKDSVDAMRAVQFAIYRFVIQDLEITADAVAFVLQAARIETTIQEVRACLAQLARETMGEFDGTTFVPIEGFREEMEAPGWKDIPDERRKAITLGQVDLSKSEDMDVALARWKRREVIDLLGVTPESIVTNSIEVKLRLPSKGTLVKIDMAPALEGDYKPTLESARNRVLRDLEESLDRPVVHVRTTGDEVVAYVPGDVISPPVVRYYATRLSAAFEERQGEDLDAATLTGVAEWVLRSGLRAFGFFQHRGRKEFYRIEGPDRLPWGGRTLSRFHGFEVDVAGARCIADGEATVTFWVDPVSRDGFLLQDVLAGDQPPDLGGARVLLMPGGWNAAIEGSGPENVDLASYIGEGDRLPLAEKFERRFGARIPAAQDSICVVRRDYGPKRPEDWPESMVLVSIRDPRFEAMDRKAYPTATMEPAVRIDQVEWLVRQLQGWGGWRARGFDAKVAGPLSLGELDTGPGVPGRAHRPKFVFGRGKAARTTIDVFRHGPYSGEKTIRIVSVLVPDGLQLPIADFLEELQKSFSASRMGTLLVDGTPVHHYSTPPDLSRLVGLTEGRMANSEDEFPLVIGIMPGRSSKARVILKEAAQIAASAPCQCVAPATVSAIQARDRGVARGLGVQLYLKCLRPGEALWKVDPPVDGTGDTAFVGVGYSTDPTDPEKRANSFAALSDPSGAHTHWQGVGTLGSREKYMTPDAVANLHRFILGTLANTSFKRVVIYRRGDFYPQEKAAILEAFGDSFRKRYALDFVSAKDTSARFAIKLAGWDGGHGDLRNVPPGFYVPLDNTRVLLSTSFPEERSEIQGTTRLVLLTHEHGTTPLEQIVEEYRAQTFLCWESPANPGKSPLVLHLCDELAELMRYAREDGVCSHFPG